MPGADILTAHIELIINFELHRRKTFWVDESLAYMLAKTDLDVPGSDLRVPFACFALVFTDRYVLSLAERMLSADPKSPVSGYFLRVATVYLREESMSRIECSVSGLSLTPLEPTPLICSRMKFSLMMILQFGRCPKNQAVGCLGYRRVRCKSAEGIAACRVKCCSLRGKSRC